jgi:hypothetical protein
MIFHFFGSIPPTIFGPHHDPLHIPPLQIVFSIANSIIYQSPIAYVERSGREQVELCQSLVKNPSKMEKFLKKTLPIWMIDLNLPNP